MGRAATCTYYRCGRGFTKKLFLNRSQELLCLFSVVENNGNYTGNPETGDLQSKIDRLTEENQFLREEIAQLRSKLQNTRSVNCTLTQRTPNPCLTPHSPHPRTSAASSFPPCPCITQVTHHQHKGLIGVNFFHNHFLHNFSFVSRRIAGCATLLVTVTAKAVLVWVCRPPLGVDCSCRLGVATNASFTPCCCQPIVCYLPTTTK